MIPLIPYETIALEAEERRRQAAEHRLARSVRVRRRPQLPPWLRAHSGRWPTCPGSLPSPGLVR